jgi:hypothetical protein
LQYGEIMGRQAKPGRGGVLKGGTRQAAGKIKGEPEHRLAAMERKLIRQGQPLAAESFRIRKPAVEKDG